MLKVCRIIKYFNGFTVYYFLAVCMFIDLIGDYSALLSFIVIFLTASLLKFKKSIARL